MDTAAKTGIDAAKTASKRVVQKAPFTSCISKIYNTLIDNT